MSENKKIMKAAFKEATYRNLFEELEKFEDKNFIDVVVTEEDLFEEFLILGSKPKTEKKRQVPIRIQSETSYFSFHAQVFKELSLAQKVISIVWFKSLLDFNMKKKTLPFKLEDNTDNAIEYAYSEEDGKYILKVNVEKFRSETSYNLMYDLIVSVIKDDIQNHVLKYMIDEEIPTKYDINIFANYIEYSAPPKDFDLFILGKGKFTDEQKREFADFGNQPIEVEIRKAHNTIEGYMDAMEGYLKMKDQFWSTDKNRIFKIHKLLDRAYEETIDVDKKEYYAGKLEKQIKTLQNKRSKYRGEIDTHKQNFDNLGAQEGDNLL